MIIALLFTALAEVVFLFVYKPTQTVPTPPQALTAPTPTPIQNPAVTNYMIDYLKTAHYWTNSTYTFTQNVTGIVSSVDLPTQANNNVLTIHLEGVKGKEVTQYDIMPPLSQSVKVYDLTNGVQTPIKLSDLSSGNSIIITATYDMHTSDGKMPDSVEIQRFLK